MNLSLLQELLESHGTAGFEDQTRAIVKRELTGHGEISIDRIGNLICHKPGKPGAKRLMIAAHMDEIGFVVKFIEKDGFLRLAPLGGFDPRQLNSQRVIVQTINGPIQGVLMFGTKPKHMLTDAEAAAPQKVENFFVDCGLTGEQAKEKIELGAMVTMDRKMVHLGNNVSCKTMDDRACVFIMIEAIKKVMSHDVEIFAVATVQEEIGLRGAAAAGSAIAPDIMVALDVTLANDIPGVGETDYVTKLGEGTAIKILDSSLVCHPKVVAHFKKLAISNGIKHQMEILTAGGTDAGAVQRLHGGIPAFTLSVPCRYVHTVNETCNLDDIQASIDLLAKYIEDAHNGDYQYS
jgi:tetrahedral aminopeptidase